MANALQHLMISQMRILLVWFLWIIHVLYRINVFVEKYTIIFNRLEKTKYLFGGSFIFICSRAAFVFFLHRQTYKMKIGSYEMFSVVVIY